MAIGTPLAGTPTEETTALTAHTVAYPATVNNGDKALLVEVNGSASNNVIPTPPTGFSLVRQESGAADTATPSAGMWQRTCNGTEGGTLLSVTTTSVTASFILVVLPGALAGAGGVDTTAFGDKNVTATSALGVASGITPATPFCTVVYVAAANSTTIAATPMTGFTELADRNTGKTGNRSWEVAYKQNVPAGALTMSGGTWGGSTKDVVIAAAFKPAPTNVTGTLATTLAGASLVASGSQKVAGTLAATLGGATLAASGKVRVAGTLAVTLGGAALAAVGKQKISGTMSTTLAGAGLTASGKEKVSGTLHPTLAGATLAATGRVKISGAIATTLAGAGLTAAGKQKISGSLATTLSSAVLHATGGPRIKGTIAVTLSGATLAASGRQVVRGQFATQLNGAALAAVGSQTIHGELAATLGDAVLSATGDVTLILRIGKVIQARVTPRQIPASVTPRVSQARVTPRRIEAS